MESNFKKIIGQIRIKIVRKMETDHGRIIYQILTETTCDFCHEKHAIIYAYGPEHIGAVVSFCERCLWEKPEILESFVSEELIHY